jgi:hypothetical protein
VDAANRTTEGYVQKDKAAAQQIRRVACGIYVRQRRIDAFAAGRTHGQRRACATGTSPEPGYSYQA